MSPHDAHHIPWKELVAPQIVNFTLFVGLLVYFVRKPLAAHFAGKNAEFEAQRRKADEARKEAEARNFEVRRLLKEQEETATATLQQAQKDSAALKAQLIADAKNSAGNTTGEAAKMAEFELLRAVSALREELISNATALAEKNLTTEASEGTQGKLNDSFIQQVQKTTSVVQGAV